MRMVLSTLTCSRFTARSLAARLHDSVHGTKVQWRRAGDFSRIGAMITKRLLLIALLLITLPALAQSRRAGQSEIYLAPTFTDGKSYSFEGGTTARTDT